MLATPDLHRLVELATTHQWRLALVGDPRQLQAVGRGGLFGELCTTARAIALEHVHRFVHPWEADASLRLRNGDTRVLDTYDAHHRIVAGTLDDHLDSITKAWLAHHDAGTGLAITTTTNEHVTLVNHAIQQERLYAGQLAPADGAVYVADGEVYVGDHITTRRNDRTLHTTAGDTVRNRDRWTVTHVGADGSIVAHGDGRDAVVTLPADYVRQHVQLGYATTEPGNQGDTQTASITLATAATTARGLYVGMTRGRESNHVLVVTDGDDIGEARDTLQRILTTDRADIPAVAQRRQLAAADRQPTRPTPRCEIPEWFAGHRAAAHERYRQAREQLEVARDLERELMPALIDARSALEAAHQAYAPHEKKIAKAQGELHDARVDLRMTEVALTAIGRRGRRAVKAAVHAAAERVSGAEVVVADAERFAAEPREARGRAEAQYGIARQQVDRLDIGDLTRRVADIESQVTALDTWCAWAQGSPVEPTLLTDAFERLVRGGPTDRALAATAAFEVRRLGPAAQLASIADGPGLEL